MRAEGTFNREDRGVPDVAVLVRVHGAQLLAIALAEEAGDIGRVDHQEWLAGEVAHETRGLGAFAVPPRLRRPERRADAGFI